MSVAAFTNINGEIYGFDVENTLFKLDQDTYARETIGQIDATDAITELLLSFGYADVEIPDVLPGYAFEVRDMDYDAANDRLLILGNIYDVMGGEIPAGNGVYEVDMTNGSITKLYTFENHYYVMAMAVDAESTVYFYNTFDDNYATLDLESGEFQNIISLQSQSYYGDNTADHALYFDEITGKLYHLFTPNATFYRLFSVDVSTGVLKMESEFVGDVYYDYDIWAYNADTYAGLTFINEDGNAGMPDVPVEPEYAVEWKSISASLGGNIGLNFYVKLSADLVNEPSTFVRFTYAGKTVDVPMSEAVISDKGGETRYRFTLRLSSKQMGEQVTAQVMTADGAVGAAVTKSVADYCNYILGNNPDEKTAALMKAMLNYGAAAQVLFDYKTEELANAGLDDADKVLAEVDASAWAHTKSGSVEGITVNSATLLLDSETTIRIYFTLTGEKTIDEYTFTVDGQEVTPVEKGGRYYISYSNIAAHKLGDMHTFCIDGFTLTYSGLSYVNVLLNDANSTPAAIDMAKALFAYYEAAAAYAG